ncbi:hypothetical protein CIB84_016255, partial [Bambusicola thoracicus]
VLYKEDVGMGTPTPVTPEIERVKRNQEHVSSVSFSVKTQKNTSLVFHLVSQPAVCYCYLLIAFASFSHGHVVHRCCTKRTWGWEPPPLSLLRLRESDAIKNTLARYLSV